MGIIIINIIFCSMSVNGAIPVRGALQVSYEMWCVYLNALPTMRGDWSMAALPWQHIECFFSGGGGVLG